MKKEIKEVKNFYNLDCNIKRYGDCIDKVGLWESEKIIYSKYISKISNR